MSGFEVLYYPGFEPPTKWFRSFLLFFDKIITIVPKDIEFEPSKDILGLLNLVPNAFETISPTEEDIAVEELNLSTMRTAFGVMREEEQKTEREGFKILIDGKGISIPGYVLLHNKKVCHDVFSLLREFKLIKPELTGLFAGVFKEDFYVVNENASNLILSNVADRIGSLHGWHTITDKEIYFAVNAVNSLQHKSIRDPVSMLAYSVITCEIPREIQYVPPEKYKEIHDSYSGIREKFHRVMADLSNLHRLGKIEDKDELKQRVKEITQVFHSEVEKLKKSGLGRAIKRWYPIGIGGLASVAAGITGGPIAGGIGAAASVIIQVIQEHSNKGPSSEKEEIQRLIGRMQNEIMKTSIMERIATLD